MLSTPAPFPNVGANALLIEEHKALPVRILQNLKGRGRRREVLVSIINRYGSSANRRVTLDTLACADPLSEAEEAEYEKLERELAGKARPLKAKAKRHEELRLRANHHQMLIRLEYEGQRAAARERFRSAIGAGA